MCPLPAGFELNAVVKRLTGGVVVTGVLGPGALNPNTWFELPPLTTRLRGDMNPLRGDLQNMIEKKKVSARAANGWRKKESKSFNYC